MGTARGVFFEEEHARAAVRRLERDGYDARLGRERFAGEDDDEDHPWVVTTDGPDWALEILVEEYDGWLDVPDAPAGPAPATPLVLPTAPRRVRDDRAPR